MEIIPNKGIGNIQFGMTPTEVKAIMGQELVYEEWMGGNLNDTLYYSGIVLCFDRFDGYGPLENGQLIEIWIDESFNGTYKGMYIFDLNLEDIKQLLFTESTSYKTREGGDSTGIYIEAYNCGLSFENLHLVQVNLYAPK